MAVEYVAHRGVTADEKKALRGGADAEFLEKPEQPLDRDVDRVVGRLLAGREMHDVGDAVHRTRDHPTVGDRSAHARDARIIYCKGAVVAERTHRGGCATGPG